MSTMKNILEKSYWRNNIVLACLLLTLHHSHGLTEDVVFLLSFKHGIINDPLSVLQSWNCSDPSPCYSWHGVSCEDISGLHVTSLKLPNDQLHGSLHENLGKIRHLQHLDLSNNSINGTLPASLFHATELAFLDLSNNFISGSFPEKPSVTRLRHLNVSGNMIVGTIPKELGDLMPVGSTLDLSFNMLTGKIPDSGMFLKQKTASYRGNLGLCGQPTRTPCPVHRRVPSSTFTPAMAAIPKQASDPGTRLKLKAVIGIVIGDAAGVVIFSVILIYAYQTKRKRNRSLKTLSTFSCSREDGETGKESASQRCENEDPAFCNVSQSANHVDMGVLVNVSEKELSLETLLKAPAYVLGATSCSILYKAVLEDGTAMAVRRISDGRSEPLRDFENHVRFMAKFLHPNLVQVRGFHYGPYGKLVIHDFVPGGSLVDAKSTRKPTSSLRLLHWEARLKIARGVARGLCFLHDKKQVHGNIKPNNILLGPKMDTKISDFAIDRLFLGDALSKMGGSTRNFGSKRSNVSHDSMQEFGLSPSSNPSLISALSPYHPPESLRCLKPNYKWDVYAFGIVLFELLTGKVITMDELSQGETRLIIDDQNRAMRIIDPCIRVCIEGRLGGEEEFLCCLRLACCCASPIPQKRPSMKEALQVLEKVYSSHVHQ